MTSFNAQGGISIFELCIYFPALIVAAIVCKRHGFHRSQGWVFTLILCLVRVVGACCQLATYQTESMGLIEAVIILESLGISPLLFATLGLLSRCADSTGNASFNVIYFRLVQLLILIGLILAIVGGTSSISATGAYQTQTTSQAGVILYLVAFIALLLIGTVTARQLSNAPREDKRLVWAVLIALPLILVRIIYSLVSVFAVDDQFNLLTGSVVIHVFMAVLEEMIVVCMYLAVGWMTAALPASHAAPISSRPWKGTLAGGLDVPGGDGRKVRHSRHRSTSGGGSGVGGGRRTRQGPIHALVGAGIAAAQQHNRGGEV